MNLFAYQDRSNINKQHSNKAHAFHQPMPEHQLYPDRPVTIPIGSADPLQLPADLFAANYIQTSPPSMRQENRQSRIRGSSNARNNNLNQLKEDLQEAREVIQRLQQQNIDLAAENSRLKSQLSELNRRYQEGQQTFYQLNNRCIFLENEVKKYTTESRSSRQNNSSSPNIVVSTSYQEIQEKQQQIRQLSIELTRLKTLEADNLKLATDCFSLKKLVDQVSFQKNTMTNQILQLSSELTRIRGEHGRIFEELKFQKNQNNRILDILNQFKAENSRLATEAQVERQNASNLKLECQRLANQLVAINNAREKEKKDLSIKIIELESSNGINMKQETERLQRQKQELTNAYNLLKAENNEMLKKIESQRTELTQHAIKQYEDAERIRDLEQKNGELRQKAEDSLLLRKRQEQIRELGHELRSIRSEVLRFETQKLQKNTLIAELNQQIIQLRKFSQQVPANSQTELQDLRKHLEFSAKEMKQVYQSTRDCNQQLMLRVEQLAREKQEIAKKYEYQQLQLNKLYEVLQARREELETCYKTISSLRQEANTGGSDYEQSLYGDSGSKQRELSQLLRIRRENLL